MRSYCYDLIREYIKNNEEAILILGDIGAGAFKNEFKNKHPRFINAGILEQSMVGFAAGLALGGLFPICHSITPFLIERPYEQIKIDFAMNQLNGLFISTGSSYDYSRLGPTHHGFIDLHLLASIPGIDVYFPGNKFELEESFKKVTALKEFAYIRLSERDNEQEKCHNLGFSKLKSGNSLVLIIASNLVNECKNIFEIPQLEIWSLNGIYNGMDIPNLEGKKVIFLEETLEGSLANFLKLRHGFNFEVLMSFGVKPNFIRNYGSIADLDKISGLNMDDISFKIKSLIL